MATQIPAALLACITLGLPVAVEAQEQPGLSSGSGQGTGSGRSAGIQRNPTGSTSGVGPERGRFGGGYVPSPPGTLRPSQSIPMGPGVNVRFPDDPALGPLFMGEELRVPSGTRSQAIVTPEMLENARLVGNNYDRSRALLELTRESILSNQLLLAHRVLEQAGTAALNEPDPLRHDQLIIELIKVTELLTETLIREGRTQPSLLEPSDTRPQPLDRKLDTKLSLRLAKLEWQRGAYMARRIKNPTFRSEYIERVVEGLGKDSARIVDLVTQPAGGTDGNTGVREEPDNEAYRAAADDFLVEGSKIAADIERPIWRNLAYVRTAVVAGESKQFARAVSVAREIENPEARAQGFLLVAESQARARDDTAATESYSEVAKAIARVSQVGLRGVLTGFLVDSLISTGRFEDARASLVLYPTESERFVALEAIAENQGRRGSAADAREWIARDAPPEYRPALYRRVNNGLLAAVRTERSNLFGGGREGLASPAQP